MIKQVILFAILFLFINVDNLESQTKSKQKSKIAKKDTVAVDKKPLITFIELGSVRCIPCRMMQPVMKSVEEKYGDQIKVVFYDVWREEQAIYGQIYNIRVIPTQVFLDKDGKEIFRHEGYFPEKELDDFLQSKGLKVKSKRDK